MGIDFGSLFGGSAPKADTALEIDTGIEEGLDSEKEKAKRVRASLYETEGGMLGQELQPGQVQRRPTLLGN